MWVRVTAHLWRIETRCGVGKRGMVTFMDPARVGVAQARRNRLRKVSKRKNSSIGPSKAWAIPSGARMP